MNDPVIQFISGTGGLVLLAFLVALGIYWLLFPLFMYSKMNRTIKHLESIATSLEGQTLVQRNFFSDVREKLKRDDTTLAP